MSITIRTAFAAAALAGAGLLAAPAAQAAVTTGPVQAAVTAGPVQAAALPSCVSTTTWMSGIRYVKVTNNCSTTKRAKVLFRTGGTNSPCKTLAPGASFTHGSRGVYFKTESC
ncbi:hypothetical protein [Nonomuraea longicatena]|uniref:Alpha amylase inhibitor n=1 Tax=Nonomuraea longicatena TaxID=83682 RepID=A0ABN1P2Y2_9ACTN